VAGADRFATADQIDRKAFPAGEPTVFLADGMLGHQSDALAASGLEGLRTQGVLLTDNTGQVPPNTLTALGGNKVTTVNVLGGTAAVSSAQITQLRTAGYTVNTPYQGATRYDTMKMVDETIGAANVGTDTSGKKTGLLASGDDTHLVDALSAGGLAYSKHFPIILTNSSSPTLQPQAAQVISDLGITALIVVGGTAAVPASQYAGLAGVTIDHVATGSDRSATSKDLSEYAISQRWDVNTGMSLARGDDGADALAAAPLIGGGKLPQLVTNSPTDVGSATAFASAHASTLAGPSPALGGPVAVPDQQLSAIATAGGGTFP